MMNQPTSNHRQCNKRQELLQRVPRPPDGIRRLVRLPGWQGGQLCTFQMLPAACHMHNIVTLT